MRGEVIRMTRFDSVMPSGKSSMSARAPKGKVCVAIIIGTEDKTRPDATNEDYIKMVEALGYKRANAD